MTMPRDTPAEPRQQKQLPMATPDRPVMGARCNGCGDCCVQEVCGLGIEVLGESAQAPCPLLRQHDGRFWCGVIEEAERVDVAFAGHMKWRLGIGNGCFTGGA